MFNWWELTGDGAVAANCWPIDDENVQEEFLRFPLREGVKINF